MSVQIDTLKKLIDLSQQALAFAEAADWENFLPLEQDRQALVSQINTDDVSIEQLQQIRQQMQQLIVLNEQIEHVCKSQRDEAAQQLQNLQKGAKAKKAYGG